MQELLDWLEYLEEGRQQGKVRHTLKDILVTLNEQIQKIDKIPL